ncbi:hypothetical protein WMY93_033404 [Mugilogobius chulae]|uniref:LRRC8 pannexin-like TM region domain-containing protein n=1 Tax=Mugilogobius chulae TaxID=88201 RepID=A0AAW0MNX1_9GOBI
MASRIHLEEDDIVYRLYLLTTIIKVISSILIIFFTAYTVQDIQFSVVCNVKAMEKFTGHGMFYCTHPLSPLFEILACFYISLVVVYGLICTYALWWTLSRSLKRYSFESIREESSYIDIPDAKNDFAFMLHMADQCDPRYSKLYAVFHSEVSENERRQVNLNNERTLEKLRQSITKNSQDKIELGLFMLSGIPDSVFDFVELEVLKLALMPDVTIPPTIAKLSNLSEMWLRHSPAKIEAPALAFLRENLKSLHVNFIDIKEIPLWIYSLTNLSELHLTGNLSADRFIVIHSLRELKQLKVLSLEIKLTKLPKVVTDVGAHLQKLSINNEGTKLMDLKSLKKMDNLSVLELVRCDLKHIPDNISCLENLQEIDLKGNNLKTIEEIIFLEFLQRLVCLKLWYNQIMYIPTQINILTNLEQLYLNRNKIEIIPSQLFLCHKLRFLDLSHNRLTNIPAEVGFLQDLQYFAVTANMIETLPPELFQCKKMRTLNLGNNRLQSLPSGFGELTGLTQLELRGNRLECLPVELGECRRLKRSGLDVEEDLFNTLPSEVKEQLWRDEKEQFSEDGYVVLDGLLSPAECHKLKHRVSLIVEEMDVPERCVAPHSPPVTLSNLKHRYESMSLCSFVGEFIVSRQKSVNKVGHGNSPHAYEPLFKKVTHSPKVQGIEKKLGLMRPVILQSMYIFIIPGNGGQGVTPFGRCFAGPGTVCEGLRRGTRERDRAILGHHTLSSPVGKYHYTANYGNQDSGPWSPPGTEPLSLYF